MRAPTGTRDALTDVVGVCVGHEHRIDQDWATGVSVVLMPGGAATAVDVRGGGPGTRETDALDPAHRVQRAHAVVMTGGSAYGLAAADGVTRWLGERRQGFAVGQQPWEVVPIVPAAVLFDLPMNTWGNRPDAEFGYRACEAAQDGAAEDHADQDDTGQGDTGRDEAAARGDRAVAQGNVGAGAGLVAGGVRGGIGTASAVLPSGTTIGALVAVNASGSVIDPESGLPWGVDRGREADFGLRAPASEEVVAARGKAAGRPSRNGSSSGSLGSPEQSSSPGQVGVPDPLNSTVGVVATDVGMTKTECQRLAVAGQDGLARAIRPAHGMSDGDTIFAVATGARPGLPTVGTPEWAGALDEACAGAADAVARAVVRALLAAESLGDVTSYTDLYPSVRE